VSAFLDIWEAIDDERTAAWVRGIYVDKLRDLLLSPAGIREEDLTRIGALLRRLPEGADLIDEVRQQNQGAVDILDRACPRDAHGDQSGKPKARDGTGRP
jgi:hypothetical protein